MGLEVFGFIKDLVATNPLGTDGKNQGDDHIRGMKETQQNQWAGLTLGVPVTVDEDDINSIPAMQAEIDGLTSPAADDVVYGQKNGALVLLDTFISLDGSATITSDLDRQHYHSHGTGPHTITIATGAHVNTQHIIKCFSVGGMTVAMGGGDTVDTKDGFNETSFPLEYAQAAHLHQYAAGEWVAII